MSKQTIWNGLRLRGFNETATAAIMGNMEEESSFFPPRIQGDFTNGYKKSIDYTAKVDRGEILRSDFIYRGPGGGGYGLCQWTYPTRKAGLYDLAMGRSKSVGDEEAQLDWLMRELNDPEYTAVLNKLHSDADLYDMTATFLRKFEKPADQSDGACKRRTQNAQRVLKEYGGSPVEGAYNPPENENPNPSTFTPSIGKESQTCDIMVRVLTMGDMGRDVFLLQSGLADMGYNLGDYGADGAFGSDTEWALRLMQCDCNLDINGIAGREVWQVMFQ